jgi:thioredoxin 1
MNTNNHNEIAGKYNVQSVPTLIIFKNGKQIWRQSGVVSKSQTYNILSKINKYYF